MRLVAGLETITSGSVAFGDRVVNGVSPRHRDVAMVFQNYALCPHLTVYQNIGSQRLPVPSGSGPAGYQGRKIIIGIRPEDLGDPASEPEAGDPALCVDVRLVEVLGSEQHVYFAIDATPLGSGAGADLAAIATNGVARVAAGAGIRPGNRVRFTVDPARLHFFDPDTGAAVSAAVGAD